jgi:hypothetical protein
MRLLANIGISNIAIINSLGQIIFTSKLSAGSHQIDLKNVPHGIYVVKAGDGEMYKTIKLIVE